MQKWRGNVISFSDGEIDPEGRRYDVFLNFRGSDTRHGFTDILYKLMIDAGIRVFIDDNELHHSKAFGDDVKRAIYKCKIFLPIFSRNYASSAWCLRELAMMVDICCNKDSEKTILPIFYDVVPLDVALQTDLYQKALDEHKSKYEHEIIQKWEDALSKVGRISGRSSKHIFREADLGPLVVWDVLRIMNRRFPKHLIGTEDQVDEMMKLLNCGSPEIRCIVVHGTSGIGKTTLANIVFNKISSHFEGSSFIPDVRRSSEIKEGILKLQQKLLDDILSTQHGNMFMYQNSLAAVGDVIDLMRRTLQGKMILLVLDDMDESEQLKNLVGNCNWLGPTSRIIITTTSRSACDGLMMPGVVCSFEMKGLANDHAIRLFSRHAFGEDKPPDNYLPASRWIVHAVGNLPLALEVVGAHLFGKTVEAWENALYTLRRYKDAPDKVIMEFLFISYKGLNDKEKEIFLDISNCSSHVQKRYASNMWERETLDNKSAVLALARKSLIRILPGNELWMHDQLRELGRWMSLFMLSPKCYGMGGRPWTTSVDSSSLKRRKEDHRCTSGVRGTPDVSDLTPKHHSSCEYSDLRVSPGQSLSPLPDDMSVDDRPSSQPAAETRHEKENIDGKADMEDGNGESSEALVRSLEKAQLAADELLIGIEHKVDAVVELMNLDSDSIGIIGICGPNGYGKTTLAKAVCSQISPQFDAFCFLEEIREVMMLPHGIQSVDNKLKRDIQRGKCSDGGSPLMRSEAFSESELPHTKVLIVLDDIKDFSHIKELIGHNLSDRFGKGSRIIATAGGNHMDVENLGGDWVMIYHIGQMEEESALRIFSQHAFGQDSPFPGYRGIAKTIISGLKMCPLLIEVVGSLLHGKKFDQFKSMSKSLEPLTQGLVDILRMSYHALDGVQKQTFLDIACFGSNEDARTAKYMWHDCLHEYPNQILAPHARVGKDNRLWMHSYVRQLGREIVSEEGSAVHSGMCSRVFVHQKAMDIVINGQVTENVEALCLNFGVQQPKEPHSKNEQASLKLTAENFKNMPWLRYLALDDVTIVGDFNDVFTELKWLWWKRCPENFEATNVNMERLIILDVTEGPHTENWGGWKAIHMPNLKVLNLSHCNGLVATPPLNGLPKLERLILEGCSQLVNVDCSIGILKCLMFLNLKFCRGLRKLPRELGKLEALRELLIDGTRVEEIPEINKLGKLEVLSSADCTLLGCIPDSIGGLKNLRALTLRGCRRIQKLPDNLEGPGSSLVELDISGTGVLELPTSIASLGSLKVLRMESCHITELPRFIGSLLKLEEVHASCCRNLKDISSEIGKLSQLRILELRYASISSLPESMKNLDRLEVLDLLHCHKVEKLPKLPACLKLLQVNPKLQQEIQFA